MNRVLKIPGIFSLWCALALTPQVFSQNSKTVISEKWRFGNNSSPVFYKAKSKTDQLRNVYVVGATLNSQNNRDLIIQKLDPSGNLLWENVIDGDANMEDIGTDVFIDNQFNVYVTGTVNRLGTQEDLTVLKYSSNGTLIWDYYTDGVESESGTALTVNASKLYVTGVTASSSTLSDYLTISLDATNGSYLWSNTYNYADLNEVPVCISIRNNDLYVTGASQLSLNPQMKWEMATIKYNASNGAQNSENRSTGNSTQGVDEVHDFTIDDNGDIYIVGGVVNQSTGFDIAIYKLDNNLNLIWEQLIDESGLNDVAYGIKLDNSGNIYLTGYVTRQNEGKNIFIKKFDNTGGNIWSKELRGQSNLDDVGIQLSLVDDTTVYLTGFIRNNTDADYIVTGFKSDGTILTTIGYDNGSNLDEIPTSICTDLDGNLIVTGQINYSGGFKTKTIKYEIYNRNIEYTYNSSTGKPEKVNDNLIVRFNKKAVNVNTYSNKNVKAGPAYIFLNANALNEMSIKTGIAWENLRCYKIHSTFGPNDSLSVARYGDTIQTNDFWTALLIETPKASDENILIDSLLTINDFIRTAGLNAIYFPSSAPNDTFYPLQNGLFPNSTYPDADINVETAWLNEVGNENIKVGVIDYLIDYFNPDFGDGTYLGSKVRGYDCLLQQDISIFQFAPYDSHGTAVAGIIGAQRNNGIGVAGIAGGDAALNNKGVSLYSFVIFSNNDSDGAEAPELLEALALGNLSTTDNNGYGVHVQNMSFGGPLPSGDLFETLDEGFKNGCAYVAARGNDGLTTNAKEYPACYAEDKVIMNVIASGTNGEKKDYLNGANEPYPWGSSFGYVCPLGNCVSCDKVDFMAPGTIELVKTTLSSQAAAMPYQSCNITNNSNFGCFNGTSAAAPHVTGAVALMLSKHQPSNGYPNGLISEDLERILEKNTYVQPQSFSLNSGYGRINVGESLEKVTDPYYIKHVELQPTTVQNFGNLAGTHHVYTNNSVGVPPGDYNVQIFKCTWNENVTLLPGHNIIDYWNLEVLTKLGMFYDLTPAFILDGGIIQNEILQVSIGSNTSSMSGYTTTYKLTHPITGATYWYPCAPSELKYSYSLHILKQPDASISDLNNDLLVIYPNPTNNEIEIQLKAGLIGNFNVEIVDEIGKVVIKKDFFDVYDNKISVSHLKEGIYFCKLVCGDNVVTKSFIKTR